MMKKVLILTLLLCVLTPSSKAQSVQEQRVPVKSASIPKLVLYTFEKEHPDVALKSWYVTHLVYWENDLSAGWYSDWYGNRQRVVYVYEKPNYFEVEYNEDPGEVSRSIYNSYGYCYETRTIIKGLPKVIVDSLKASNYADWKISTTKERIVKAGWPEPIYRIHIHKGARSRIIRISQSGEIIQEKRISEL